MFLLNSQRCLLPTRKLLISLIVSFLLSSVKVVILETSYHVVKQLIKLVCVTTWDRDSWCNEDVAYTEGRLLIVVVHSDVAVMLYTGYSTVWRKAMLLYCIQAYQQCGVERCCCTVYRLINSVA
jgi:hypothetical protein